jgi:hypothetical protein
MNEIKAKETETQHEKIAICNLEDDLYRIASKLCVMELALSSQRVTDGISDQYANGIQVLITESLDGLSAIIGKLRTIKR